MKINKLFVILENSCCITLEFREVVNRLRNKTTG